MDHEGEQLAILVDINRPDVLPIAQYASLLDIVEPFQEGHDTRLPGAGYPDQGRKLPFLNRSVELFEDGNVAGWIFEGDIFQLDPDTAIDFREYLVILSQIL